MSIWKTSVAGMPRESWFTACEVVLKGEPAEVMARTHDDTLIGDDLERVLCHVLDLVACAGVRSTPF
jgi:hypothetical protein